MRTRSIEHFMHKLESNNLKNLGPRSKLEIINEEIAEYYFAQKKEIKKVA